MRKKILYLSMFLTTSLMSIPVHAELKHTIVEQQVNVTNIVASVPDNFNKPILVYIKKSDGKDAVIQLTSNNQYIYKDEIPVGETKVDTIKIPGTSDSDFTIYYSGDISTTKDKQGNLKINVVSKNNDKEQVEDTDKDTDKNTDEKPIIEQVPDESSTSQGENSNEEKEDNKATTDKNELYKTIKSLAIDGLMLGGLGVIYLFLKYKQSKGDM